MSEKEREAAREILGGEADVGQLEPLPEDRPDYIAPEEVGLVDGPSVEVEKLTPEKAYVVGRLLAKLEQEED